MDEIDSQRFVDRWLAAWNSHDVEAVLAEMADDVVFTSPLAARLFPGSGGVIRGKAALRDYWTRGLALVPDLHFTVEGWYVGVDALVIHYRNQRGGLVNEVLLLDGDTVVAGHATYLSGGAAT